ncbi:LOW QUALITY PROTEIN: uncharacterized protein LOC123511683 [Portunus trituberculatus]|uniref:LOW QUALITY PROTEIN: uncharacterized protein LOC123511683 n=1 Tax=Portunus trituberculatus TaxID=210409 RepID=UPI001E1D04FF|nr:LOW QUALITY PROTEIN: uncharacterized protein LOC123511683 [Portunus trituberculatus]
MARRNTVRPTRGALDLRVDRGNTEIDEKGTGCSSKRNTRIKSAEKGQQETRDKYKDGSSEALIEMLRMMQGKLPKLRAGSIGNYWAFKRQFEELFLNSSASAMHKLNQLYSSCDWEVQQLIVHCMVLPASQGLKMALEILDERFGDKNMYLNQSREMIINGPAIRETDYKALSQLCARLTSYISSAENFGKLTEIDNTSTIRDILLRLDSAMRIRWNAHWTGKRANRTQRIKDVLQFVKETKRVEIDIVLRGKSDTEFQRLHRREPDSTEMRGGPSKSPSTFSMKRDTKRLAKPQGSEMYLTNQTRPYVKYGRENAGSDKCRLCGESHTLPLCTTFRSLPVHHRKKVVRAQGRCFMCLQGNHLVKDCRVRPCDIKDCKGRHSSWLHEDEKSQKLHESLEQNGAAGKARDIENKE